MDYEDCAKDAGMGTTPPPAAMRAVMLQELEAVRKRLRNELQRLWDVNVKLEARIAELEEERDIVFQHRVGRKLFRNPAGPDMQNQTIRE